MGRARIVFMGTPRFAVPTLERLIDEYEVVGIYTQPDKPAGRGKELTFSEVKKAALARGLEVYQPISLRYPQEAEKLAKLSPDVIVVAAFGQILSSNILAIPPLGCVNVHPSLLPRHRGPSPVASAILAGDEVTGVTIMLMDSGVDTGPILSQREVAISPQDTTGSLEDRLAAIGSQLLIETLRLWLEGKLTPRPQDKEGASYSKLIVKEEGEIDWSLSAVDLWRRVRAFQPWPGCYTWWRGRRLKIIEVVPLSGGKGVGVGQVVALKGPQAVAGVGCGEGVLGVRQVQLEGKRFMSAEEFLRGQKDFIGTKLG